MELCRYLACGVSSGPTPLASVPWVGVKGSGFCLSLRYDTIVATLLLESTPSAVNAF